MSLAPSTLAPSAIVTRIETVIAADADWHVSHHAYPDFPPAKDSGDVSDHSFAVGVLGTESLEGRQRASVGAHALTELRVRFLADVQADDKRGSYTRYLGMEADLVALVLSVNRDPDLTVRLESIEPRENHSETTLLGEAVFAVRHMYPLTT